MSVLVDRQSQRKPTSSPSGGWSDWFMYAFNRHPLRISAGDCVFILGMALLFAFCFANRTLWHTDLWDHVNYGRYILENGSIPDTEPLLQTAADSPMIFTAWGAQVLMSLAVSSPQLGISGLQFGYGLLVVAAVAVVGWCVRMRTESTTFGFVAAFVFLFVNWQQFLIIRPQLAGVLLFSICVAVVYSRRFNRSRSWLCLPVLFCVWANLHGSFAMGLTLLGLVTAGRGIDLILRTGKPASLLKSSAVRKLLLLTVACTMATLATPNGISVYGEIFRIGRHPNIASMYEWNALTLQMKQGRAALAACVVLAAVLFVSRRRMRFTELLPMAAFLVLAIWSSRMLNWFAPVCGLLIGIHGAAALRRLRRGPRKSKERQRSGLYAAAAVLAVLICSLTTNLGQKTVFGKLPKPQDCLSAQTPINAAKFLAEHHEVCTGPAFLPAEWAGYITNQAPKIQPFVNLHVHVLPADLWADYLRLNFGSSECLSLLEKYGLNVVVTDRTRQARLTKLLRSSSDFSVMYEDQLAVIFCRPHSGDIE